MMIMSDFNPKPYDFLMTTYIERRALFQAVRKLAPQITGSVLDVGCGKKPYEYLFTNAKKYIGLDHIKCKSSENKADCFYDGKKFPLKSSSFDSIVCTEVLEHVEDDQLFINECKRVLKPNGIMLLSMPFMWEEHEEPYDFRRFNSFGLKNALIKKGFKVITYEKTTSEFLTIIQLLILFVLNKYSHKQFILKRLFLKAIIVKLNFLAFLFWNTPGTGKLYIDNIILVRK